jgi:hypothetical protein
MPLSAPALGRTDHASTVIAVNSTSDNSRYFTSNNDGDPTWHQSVIGHVQ